MSSKTMKPDEMVILKAASFKPTDDTIAIVSLMYHCDHEDRSKSQYRYEGRVVKEADLKAEIADMATDAKKMEPWKWPSESMKDWTLSYFEMTNARGSKWLSDKVKKAKSLEDGMKILNGWKPSSDDYKDSRKYQLNGYTYDDGTTVDLTEDFFKNAVGHTFSKILEMKRKPAKIYTSETCDKPEAKAEESAPAAEASL